MSLEYIQELGFSEHQAQDMLKFSGGPCLMICKEFRRASFNERVVPTVGFQQPYYGIYDHPNFARALVTQTRTWHADGSEYDEFGVVHRCARVPIVCLWLCLCACECACVLACMRMGVHGCACVFA